ncbi:MAG: protein-export chaperone SecB [Rhizobiales bacterium]|jgi:preprotein translocase subunit SecB|nr:protein-export chaperone SecB [Hyphomicrobiales bacterium]
MSDTSSNGGGTEPATSQGQQPGIHVLGQYIKDLSFENPGAPRSLRPSDKAPKLDVNVNVSARPQSESEFEIELKLEAKAARGEETLFIAEVNYAGLFQIRNVPQEHIHPLLLIECPRLLFPFARQIIADATRQGGFPPLMIDPVDFAALYRQRIAELNVQQAAAATPS